MSFSNLIVESDTSNVILILNVHQQYLTFVGYIIRDCINFNVSFYSLDFLNLRCKANQTDRYLAKYIMGVVNECPRDTL
jgi:hypothetical protein